MADDERTRRRLGDETKGRIANLASGWTVDPEVPPAPPSPPPAAAAPEPRKKAKTLPPPPPGSDARKALEAVEAVDAETKSAATKPVPLAPPVQASTPPVRASTPPAIAPPPPPPRGKPPTAPPPPVPAAARAKPPTAPPPIPPPPPPAATGDASVPIGEFAAKAEADPTVVRDPANAVLGIADVTITGDGELRGDPTMADPSTSKFERGDPTQLGRSEMTVQPARMHSPAGRLRTVAQLRRQRGVWGDVLYVKTVLFGVRRSRQEHTDLEAKQALRQQGRRRYLVTLGRTAVTSEGFDHPALGPARERLGNIEDERARHHAQVGAADQELQRVTRERETNAKQYATDLAAVDAELAELTKRLEPLQKEQVQITRKAADMREALRRADSAIAEATANLTSVKSGKKDPAALAAELATLKADRLAVQKDEPQLAAELDALNPRIAALEAKRTESTRKREELVERETNDQRRSEELLAAIGAKRKVMDRAAGDAETARDKILFELGERLYVDRPDDLGPQLAPIDAIDVELGVADRRLMELREILSTVDRWKLVRGILVLVLVVGVIGAAAAWLIYVTR